MRYYIADNNNPKGFREVTEEEFNEFRQYRAEVNAYAEQVANGEISIEDVPETHRADVSDTLVPTMEEKATAYDILMGVSE